MKQKINLRLLGIAMLAVIVTTLSVTLIYYRAFQRQVRSDLRTEAEAGRLHPETLALFLDKYYVIYQKRSLYGSDFRKFLQPPALNPEDRPLSDSLRRDIGLSPLPDSLFRQP